MEFRITIQPDAVNGLQVPSQIMVDKPVTVRRARIGRIIGHLSAVEVTRLDAALAFVLGIED